MPFKRVLGFIPPMPNEGSEHQTPASLMCDTHYCQLRLVERWSWVRYVRLCQFLRMTPWEVASMVTLRHSAVDTFKRHGRLSRSGHRAIALVLTMLEAHVMRAWTDDIIENPFPDLNTKWEPHIDPATEHLRERLRVARAVRGLRRTSKSSAGGCSGNGGSHEPT